MLMRYLLLVLFFVSATANADSRHFSKEFSLCMGNIKNTEAQSICTTQEVIRQKKRLNANYAKVLTVIPPDDVKVLDKVQRDWITWRDGNFNFLSEHVPGEYVTTRITSLNFLLNCIYDRAEELEVILSESGH